MKNPRVTLAVMLAVSTLLSGCEQPAAPPPNTVAAKVGDDTISEFELDRAVARLGSMSAADAAEARGKVLEALIDQHLVSHAARNAKLDKLPEVALAMQQAQRQVLVEAYMERLVKDLPNLRTLPFGTTTTGIPNCLRSASYTASTNSNCNWRQGGLPKWKHS